MAHVPKALVSPLSASMRRKPVRQVAHCDQCRLDKRRCERYDEGGDGVGRCKQCTMRGLECYTESRNAIKYDLPSTQHSNDLYNKTKHTTQAPDDTYLRTLPSMLKAPKIIIPRVLRAQYDRGDPPIRDNSEWVTSSKQRTVSEPPEDNNFPGGVNHAHYPLMSPSHSMQENPWKSGEQRNLGLTLVDSIGNGADADFPLTLSEPVETNEFPPASNAGREPMLLEDMARERQLESRNQEVLYWLNALVRNDRESGSPHPSGQGLIARSASDDFHAKRPFSPGPGILGDEDDVLDFSSEHGPDQSMDSDLYPETLPVELPTPGDLLNPNSNSAPLQAVFYRAHPWQDTISASCPSDARFQPLTSNAASYEFGRRAQELDTSSCAATWGTSREHRYEAFEHNHPTSVAQRSTTAPWSPHSMLLKRFPATTEENAAFKTEPEDDAKSCLSGHSPRPSFPGNDHVRMRIRSDVSHGLQLATPIVSSHPGEGEEQATQNVKIKVERQLMFRSLFLVDWVPSAFVAQQLDHPYALGKVITITGTMKEAQAMSCAGYLRQTWPSTGTALLEVVEQMVSGRQTGHSFIFREDGTKLTCWQQKATLHLEVIGSEIAICEVAEQTAWLAAALRTAPEGLGLHLCTPNISMQRYDVSRNSMLSSTFKIGFENQFLAKSEPGEAGACWHALFDRPTIVQGYPIPSRPENSHGLEIALNLMAELVGTKYANSFDDHVFIKGYSSMLVPTKELEGLLLWHLCSKPSRTDYISFTDQQISCRQSLEVGDLIQSRHIVGWCNHAACYAGTATADFDVWHCSLKHVREEQALYGCRLSIPTTLATAGELFTLTKDQKTAAIGSVNLPNIFRSLANRYVLFYDVKCQRGWLVDGLTALLHHVFASIKVDEQQAYGSEDFQLKWDDLVQPSEEYGVGAARRFLGNQKNRSAKIIVTNDKPDGSPDYETICDRTIKLYEVLIQAFEYQKRIKARPGLSRAKLEGWDFHQIASQVPCVKARVKNLPAAGKVWVDFVRELGAVVIYGNNFGELIRPVAGGSCCTDWTSLPTLRSFFAVRACDLADIMKERGDAFAEPPRLTKSTLWYTPVFQDEGTACRHQEGSAISSLVQVPWPRKVPCPELTQQESLWSNMLPTGAAVFGYNEVFPWGWTDSGHPVQRNYPEDSDDEYESVSDVSTNASEVTNSPSTQLTEAPNLNAGKVFGNSTNTGGTHHFGDKVEYSIHHHHTSQPIPVQEESQDLQAKKHSDSLQTFPTIEDVAEPSRKRSRLPSLAADNGKRSRLSLSDLLHADCGPPTAIQDVRTSPVHADHPDNAEDQLHTFKLPCLEPQDLTKHHKLLRWAPNAWTCCKCDRVHFRRQLDPLQASLCVFCKHRFCRSCAILDVDSSLGDRSLSSRHMHPIHPMISSYRSTLARVGDLFED